MVVPFQISPFPAIYFGNGKRKELFRLLQHYGGKVLVLTGAASLRQSVAGNELLESLGQSENCMFAAVPGEPTPGMIDDITFRYREVPLSVVVAIGGGSVLDAGKAVSAMWGKEESVLGYLEGVGTRQPDGTKVPFIAVPTTSGTGSETTKNAVISRIGPDGFKKSLRHDNYIPDAALVDPELTLSCSPETTAASGLDALTQLLEAYVSVKSSPFIDALAFDGLRHVLLNLKTAWKQGDNTGARSAMSYGAMLSGIALANSGLGTVHGFASSVGGFFPIPHGVVCGTLMAPCTAVNIEKLTLNKTEAYYKYANAGRLLTSDNTHNDAYYCSLLTDTIAQWVDEMAIPRLSEFGVTKNHIPGIVAVTDNKNNPVALTPEDMARILENRL